MGGFYNGTDAQMYTGATAFGAKIALAPAVYNLTEADATNYVAKAAAYAASYLAAINPETRTTPKVEQKNVSKKELRTLTARLAKIIYGSATLTNEQILDLGLTIRRQPVPEPVPPMQPEIDIVEVWGRRVTLRVHGDEVLKRAKPPGVKGIAVWTAVAPTAPTEPADWSFNGTSSKLKVEIAFPDSVPAGSQVWFTAAFLNDKLEAGNGCPAVGTVLAGGSAAAASVRLAA